MNKKMTIWKCLLGILTVTSMCVSATRVVNVHDPSFGSQRSLDSILKQFVEVDLVKMAFDLMAQQKQDETSGDSPSETKDYLNFTSNDNSYARKKRFIFPQLEEPEPVKSVVSCVIDISTIIQTEYLSNVIFHFSNS